MTTPPPSYPDLALSSPLPTNTLGDRFRKWRIEADLSMGDMARAAWLTVVAYSRFENHDEHPGLMQLGKMAKVIEARGIPVDWDEVVRMRHQKATQTGPCEPQEGAEATGGQDHGQTGPEPLKGTGAPDWNVNGWQELLRLASVIRENEGRTLLAVRAWWSERIGAELKGLGQAIEQAASLLGRVADIDPWAFDPVMVRRLRGEAIRLLGRED